MYVCIYIYYKNKINIEYKKRKDKQTNKLSDLRKSFSG